MDKFLLKTTREKRPPTAGNSKQEARALKQATLESLKRVVVIEEILRSKAVLKAPDQSAAILIGELEKLRRKIPSVETLKQTKLGVVLKKLTKHSDAHVSRAANDLVESWKADIRDRKSLKSMDVRCDAKTERFRTDARRLFDQALRGKKEACTSTDTSVTNIAEAIERELYAHFDRRTNESYRRTVRKIVFSLRHRADLRQQVLQKAFDLKTLILANIQK